MKISKIRLGILTFALASSNAFAQLSNKGVLDTVIERYQTEAAKWASVLTGYASYLFWGLALISMVVTFGFLALKKADPMEFFAEFFKFSFNTGFFWWLLENGPTFAMDIIHSLMKAGSTAGGAEDALSPSGVVDIGFKVFFTVLDKTSVMSPVDSLIGVTLGLAVLISLTLIAVNMLLLLISGWLLAYGGIFFLGFGGARWTSEMAIGYYKTALGVGAALMGMTLVTGVGQALINDFYARMSEGINLKEMAVMLVVALAMVKLTDKVPNMLAGMAGGNIASAAGNVGLGSLAGAAAVAAGAAATGGALAMAGATNAAGGASALKAAFAAAQENMANGTGMFAGGGSGAGNVSSLAQAMGGGQGSGGSSSGSVGAAGAGGGSAGSGGGADSSAAGAGGSSGDSGAASSGAASGSGGGSGNSAAGSSGSTSSESDSTAGAGDSAGAEGNSAASSGAAEQGSAAGIAQGESAGQASGEGAAQPKADPGPWPFPTSASVKAAKEMAAQDSAQPSPKPEAAKKPGLLRTGSMFAADMGANLAKGIGKVATDKAKENLASMQEAISNTAGGQVAAAIKEKTLAAKTDDAQEDSLSQGDSKPAAPLSAEAQDEINAFVNKAA